MYYQLEPEVAGGWGKTTVIDQNLPDPYYVVTLDYCFDGWLGDELLTTHPCFIVTERIARLLQHESLTGYTIAEVTISKSQLFTELYPSRDLPSWVWLKISGKPGTDDFGMSSEHLLVVSERALHVLQHGSLIHCTIDVYHE